MRWEPDVRIEGGEARMPIHDFMRLREMKALLEGMLNGNRDLPFSPPWDDLGAAVRAEWIVWAKSQPNPKPSWLVPYDQLSEPDKQADRMIGLVIARWTLIMESAQLSAALDPPKTR